MISMESACPKSPATKWDGLACTPRGLECQRHFPLLGLVAFLPSAFAVPFPFISLWKENKPFVPAAAQTRGEGGERGRGSHQPFATWTVLVARLGALGSTQGFQ